MAHTHTLTKTLNPDGGASVQTSETFSSDGSESRTIPVPDSTTDKEVNLAIDVSQLQSIWISSDQVVTLETNAIDATGGNTIVLVAGKPYDWQSDSYFVNLLTLDVTVLYITNASGSAATVRIEFVHDATP